MTIYYKKMRKKKNKIKYIKIKMGKKKPDSAQFKKEAKK